MYIQKCNKASVLMLVITILFVGTTFVTAQIKPFPQNNTYPNSLKPAFDQLVLNEEVKKFYVHWVNTYVEPSNGTTPGGGYIVRMTGTGGTGTEKTTSEAHGYGMLIFAMMAGADLTGIVGSSTVLDAKTYFDGMYNMYDKHRSTENNNLMSWLIDETENTALDSSCATDGDMDIAYALIMAHDQWGSNGTINYLAEAKRIIQDGLKQSCMSPTTKRIMLGDFGVWYQGDGQYNTRSSDWMAGHLRAFYKVTGDSFWLEAVDTIYAMIDEITINYSPTAGLMPDFITGATPAPSAPNFLESIHDGHYYMNASRYPWRITLDYLHYNSYTDGVLNKNTDKAKAAMNKTYLWLQAKYGDLTRLYDINAGFDLAGNELSDVNYSGMNFTAPFIMTAMMNVGTLPAGAHHPQNYLDAGWEEIITTNPEGYFEDSVRMLCMLVLTGNWWEPAKASAVPTTPTPIPTPVPNSNLIINGDFSNGTNNWVFKHEDGGVGSMSALGGELAITINDAGTQVWSIQADQPNLYIQYGLNYRAKFDARADAPRTIQVIVGMSNDPWVCYSIVNTFDITTTISTYEFVFTMPMYTDSNAQLEFDLGKTSSANVYIDNVELRSTNATPAPTIEPTATPVINPTPTPTQTVGETPTPPLYDEWVPNTIYRTDDVVVHEGVIYRCKWWNDGVEPGPSADCWEEIGMLDPTPTPPLPDPSPGDIQTTLRDIPSVVYTGSRVEIVADFVNVSNHEIGEAIATLTLPQGASLHVDYPWNTAAQYVNAVGSLPAHKQLPPMPPQLYAFGSDDFNNTIEEAKTHVQPMHDQGLRMSANVLSGAMYFDVWNPDNKDFWGYSFEEYLKKYNYEIGTHTFHHSHMGLDLHSNSMWIGETSRRYKRGSTWGIPNTDQEETMEISLGKHWNEIYFDRRMEGFRSPFLEFNLKEGQESKTKTPLRSSKWKVIGELGLRYVCSVNEAPSGWPVKEVGKTPLADIDARTAVPSWPPLCDEVTVAADPKDAYTNDTHKIHNILVGTQRAQIGGAWTWGTIFDGSLMEEFSYADSMHFMEKYVDRHYTVAQNEIPHPYIDGEVGELVTQRNIPLSFGLHASYTNGNLQFWSGEGKKNNDWVYGINSYITQNYPNAQNVTHKDIIDYYLGRGTVRWVVNMPTTPGTYTFNIQTVDGTVTPYQVEVKAPEAMYNDVALKGVKIDSAADIAGLKAKGYSDVIFTVKGADGVDRSGSELDAVLAAAQSEGVGVYVEISVFKDQGLHTHTTRDYAGTVVADIAEPVDQAYRTTLKNMVSTLSTKNIKGIIMDSRIPTTHNQGATVGYSDAMISHFNKFFGPPESGTNTQDPTSENDPLHWSIYTAAATSDWRSQDIPWLTYDIKTLANTFFNTLDMSNLGADANGVQIVDWLLCKQADGSDNTGVSSWDEWEAWGEFRRYMIADFVNEIASTKGTKDVYVMVTGTQNVNQLQQNITFGDGSDPVEFADILRRPNILPDLWNQTKTDNISGIFYSVPFTGTDLVKEYAEVARRVDYWVAKGGNSNRGAMPLNEHRPANDSKVYGLMLNTFNVTAGAPFIALRNAAASVKGQAPFAVIVSDDRSSGGTTPDPTPTIQPTIAPTATPTTEPTIAPTATPTVEPTVAPTATPTTEPTVAPTATPTTEPTATPTATIAPTPTPTAGTSGCSGIAAWDIAEPWTSYSVGDMRTNAGSQYRCTNVAYAIYEPSGQFGHFGWEFVQTCN